MKFALDAPLSAYARAAGQDPGHAVVFAHLMWPSIERQTRFNLPAPEAGTIISRLCAARKVARVRQADMIELHAESGSGREARLILRPNRSMSASQLRSVFFALAAVAAGTSLISWTQGNAFAPLFALLHVGFVAHCLALAWRRGDSSEVIVLGVDRVEVWRGPTGVTAFAGHPTWVRVTTGPDGQIWLGSHGKHVTIGEFLGEAERSEAAAQVKNMLAGLRLPG